MKKLYIYGIAIIIVVVGCVAVWLHLNKQYENITPTNYIPSSATAIIKINSVDNYQSQIKLTDYLADIQNLGLSKFADSTIVCIDSLFAHSDIAKTDLHKREFYLSFHAVGKSKNVNASLLSFCLNNYIEGRNIRNSILDSDLYQTSDTTIGKRDIVIISMPNNQKCYLTIVEGCIFFSNNADLLCQLSEKGQNTLNNDVCFTTLLRTASQTAPLASFINIGSLDSVSIGKFPFNKLAEQGNWVELDFEFNKKNLVANGFLSSARPSLTTCLAQQKANNFSIYNYIPSLSNTFLSYIASERGLSSEAFVEYLKCVDANDIYRQKQEKIYNDKNVDIEARLSELFSADIALFSISNSLLDSASTCLILEANNGTIAQALLNSIIGNLHQIETPKQCAELNPIPNVNIPVYEAFNENDDLFFLDYLLPFVPRKYYLRYENTILIANSIDLLRNTLYENMLSRTLGNDADFRNFRASFPDDNVFFYFCKSPVINDVFTQSIIEGLSPESIRSLSNFYGFGMQMSSLSNLAYITIGLLYEPTRIEMPPTAWQSRLNSNIVGRPFAVVNHNTQEIEYIVQDKNNDIHLINPKGLELWSHKVDGLIVGDVTQIDYYNNRKLQYLFCTENNIYLIDRNGNNTACFPVRLPNKATSGVKYIDYDNPKDFRLFVACNDKNICLFDREGQRIQGWEMPPTEGVINRSLTHYVSKDKDYLVVSDEYRCYITDRRGNERVKLPPLAPNKNSNVVLINANTDKAAFAMLTADAKLAFIDISTNEVRKIDMPNDIDNNSYMVYLPQKNCFALISHSNIYIVDVDGNISVSAPIYLSSVDWVDVTSSGNIAIWNSDEHLGYIYTPDVKLIDGFPIPTYSPFAIANGNNVNNIVAIGKEGELNCFLK